MSDQFVKNQHYISQCILKWFANENSQVYEALVEPGRIYKTNYRFSMSEKYTYEHRILEKNKLERYFQKIEDYMGPAIEKIIGVIKRYESGKVDFLSIRKVVNYYMREFIIFYYRRGALLNEFQFERKNKEDRVLLLLENIMNSRYIRELSKTIIDYYSFAIIKSESNDFLLSDQYISTVALAIKNRFINVSNRHMGFKDVMILIPLSSQYYIVWFEGNLPKYITSNSVNLLNYNQVEEINEVIINNSYRKCIAYKEIPLKNAINKFIYQSPSATFVHYTSGKYSGATLKKEVFFYKEDRDAWEFFVDAKWIGAKNLGRNDNCVCGSGKKLKKCCLKKLEVSKRMLNDIKANRGDYAVSGHAITEKGIGEF